MGETTEQKIDMLLKKVYESKDKKVAEKPKKKKPKTYCSRNVKNTIAISQLKDLRDEILAQIVNKIEDKPEYHKLDLYRVSNNVLDLIEQKIKQMESM